MGRDSTALTSPPLACTVRDCDLPLARQTGRLCCPRGHSYDVARSGYINLLQPKDRRSLSAGDARDVVAARGRLIEAGVGRALVEEVGRQVARLPLPECPVIVDLGSGSGDALAALAHARATEAIGIDLSTAAADRAARRFPGVTWVVANADRRLPIIDASAHLVLSLHGRRNPAECARILGRKGVLLVAVPGPEDLVELRERLHGMNMPRARGESLLAEHDPHFTVTHRMIVREQRQLDRNAVVDLLRMTYRGARTSEQARVDALSSLDVTLASELFLLAPR